LHQSGHFSMGSVPNVNRQRSSPNTYGLPARGGATAKLFSSSWGAWLASFNDATALEMADQLADRVKAGEFKTTRQAAAWLRRARLSASNNKPIAISQALEELITTTIKNSLFDHPDADANLVIDALENVGDRRSDVTAPTRSIMKGKRR
jgi:hypothetical protein